MSTGHLRSKKRIQTAPPSMSADLAAARGLLAEVLQASAVPADLERRIRIALGLKAGGAA